MEDLESPDISDSPTDYEDTSAASLLSNELRTIYQTQSYVHPTHTITRTVIRPINLRAKSPLAFLRPVPVRANSYPAHPISPVSSPTIPTPRPVSPFTGALKALKLITDVTLFEESLDYFEHRWAMEQVGEGRIEIMVSKRQSITVEYECPVDEEEEQVVYPRRKRLPSLLGPIAPLFTRRA